MIFKYICTLIFNFMYSQLNDKLIHAMRDRLPEGENLAHVLMDILSLGKEAAYRRLRGDIMFTFEDVAKISRKFGFSLDKIIGEGLVLDNNKWAFIDMDAFYTSTGYADQYKQKMKLFADIFQNLSNHPQSIARMALKRLPYFFTLPYKNLTLFRHYKRTYLSFGLNPGFRFADFVMFQDMEDEELQLLKKSMSIPKNLLILERDVFSNMMKDINYFYLRKLINQEEFAQLKGELLEVLSDLENITATGAFASGSEISVYLLDVALDASYTHFETRNFECAIQYTYFVDTLSFYNPKICQMQKNWIESLKRYSTLISQTGEMQRMEFFNEQKKMMQAF